MLCIYTSACNNRLVLLLLYVSFLGSTWVVEQPMTSLLWEHPRMRWLLTTVKARDAASCIFWPSAHPVLDSAPVPRPAGDCSHVPRPPEAHKHFLWLGTWGGISPKPTHLVSNSQWIVGLGARGARLGVLRRSASRRSLTVKRYIDKSGARRCAGTKLLKQTQPPAQLLPYDRVRSTVGARWGFCVAAEVLPTELRTSGRCACRSQLAPGGRHRRNHRGHCSRQLCLPPRDGRRGSVGRRSDV